ncbi:glutamate--tRNA ligase [bacterium]|nr:glutamate--tRNA ligase [bacterium]
MNQSNSIRVRFAPSPTGYLHVGGARTALFNYLFARRESGRFLLRIEDTDKERSEPVLTEKILESLSWLGLAWDEPPVHQSSRENRHRAVCMQLLEQGRAYRCFCTPELLEEKRESAVKAGTKFKYDRTCLNLTDEQIQIQLEENNPFTLRFRTPDGRTDFDDLVHGSIRVSNEEIDDFIILRSDGSPVYQIAVVADDHDMGVTHVIRGDDHLSNTPKQILLYTALGWHVPRFGHVPLILGEDKKRLSKRHGATSVGAYREMGILPDALINFLALLGWSPGDDREMMDKNTLTGLFSLDRISKKPAVFNAQKLNWMNAQYISQAGSGYLFEQLMPGLVKTRMVQLPVSNEQRTYTIRVIDLIKSRLRNLNEFYLQARYFFQDPEEYEDGAVRKHWSGTDVSERLNQLSEALGQCGDWSEARLEKLIRGLAENQGIGAGKLIHPLRLAVTGLGSSPGLFEVMAVLGKETVMRRLSSACSRIN